MKRNLLASTAIVAVGLAFAASAHAADREIDGSVAAPNNLLGVFTTGDNITNTTATNATDADYVDLNGLTTETVTNIVISQDAAILFYDSASNADSSAVTATGYVQIDSGKTLTLYAGGSKADGSGTDGAEATTVTIAGNVGATPGTTLTRGGTLAVAGVTGEQSGPGTFNLNGNTMLTTVSVTGGTGGAAGGENGSAVTLVLGDASTDTVNVTNLSVVGGTAVAGGAGSGAGADGAAGTNGGAATLTVNGAATLGAAFAVTGSAGQNAGSDSGADAGGAGGAGGAASATFNSTLAITGGDITVTAGAGGNGGTSTGAGADAAGGAGGAASLTLAGNVTSDSKLILVGGANGTANDGGAGSGAAASATLGGATISFTNGIELTDNNGGATITFNGSAAQTVTGTIKGGADNNGTVVVTNTHASGVTFASAIGGGANTIKALTIGDNTASTGSVATFNGAVDVNGAITVGVDGEAVGATTNTATFKSTVTAGSIVLGEAAGGGTDTADTNTVVFDATGGDFTVTGAISGADAGDTNKITIAGGTGKTVTLATAMGTGIDTVTINAGTTLVNGGAIQATTVSLASGATLKMDSAATITGNVVGSSAGYGTLAINANTSLVGNAGTSATDALSSITVADNKTLTVDASGAARTIFASGITLQDDDVDNGSGGILAITAGNDVGITGAITTAKASEGKIVISDANGTITFNNDIGTSSAALESLTTTTGAVGAPAVVTKGNVYVDSISLGAGDSLTIRGGTVAVSGKLDGGAASTGDVTVGNGTTDTTSATFSGIVGDTTGNRINSFTVTNGSTATFSRSAGVLFSADAGDNTAGLTVASGATLNIATGSTADAAVNTNDGNIVFAGTVALSGAKNAVLSAADNFTIDGTFTTALTGGSTTTLTEAGAGALTIGGSAATTLNIANHVVLGGNALTIGGAAGDTTINIRATSDFTPGDTLATSLIDADTNNTVVTVSSTAANPLRVALASDSATIANGTTIRVIDSDQNATTSYATLITAGKIAFTDTALIDLQDSGSDAQDLKVKVVYKTSADGASGTASTALTNALTATQNDAAAFYALAGLTSSNSQAAGESLLPNTAGQTAVAAVASSRGAVNAVNARLAAARSGTQVAGLQQTGVAAGDGTRDKGAWAKGFGSWADQDNRGGVAGFDADTYGVAVGIDNKFTKDIRAGVSFAYANSDVDGKDVGNSQTDIDSYQFTLYGSYEPGTYFIEGSVGYALNKVDTTRQVTVGGLNRTAKGSYDADQYTANLAAGMPIKKDAFTFTPKAGLFYSYVNPDKYTETGAGALSLDVDPESVSVLEGSLGVTAAYNAKVQGGTLVPEARAGVLYDFIGDNAGTAAKFTGGGTTFNTDGLEPSQFGGRLGVGLGFNTADGVYEIRADYDAELRADYTAHTGMLTGRINF